MSQADAASRRGHGALGAQGLRAHGGPRAGGERARVLHAHLRRAQHCGERRLGAPYPLTPFSSPRYVLYALECVSTRILRDEVKPCGTRFGSRKGGKGAARLPKILVLIRTCAALRRGRRLHGESRRGQPARRPRAGQAGRRLASHCGRVRGCLNQMPLYINDVPSCTTLHSALWSCCCDVERCFMLLFTPLRLTGGRETATWQGSRFRCLLTRAQRLWREHQPTRTAHEYS